MTLKQFKAGAKLPAPIYVHKPYVILSKEDVVLAAGTAAEMLAQSTYYDDNTIEVRKYDLHLNDNTKVQAAEPLMPDPAWRQVNNSNYTSPNHGGSLSHPPAAYAQGFEDGAFALARHLVKLYRQNRVDDVVNLLVRYENNAAHPAKGWSNEPVRG